MKQTHHKTIAAATLLGIALTAVASANINGFGNFTVNGAATTTATDLTLTNGLGQAGSGFDATAQAFNQGFTSSFTYSATNPVGGGADGFTFTLQNAGANAVGGGGGGKGYAGITPSVAIVGNNFNGSSIGTGVNGAEQGPLTDTTPSGVDLRTGPVNFTISYNPANAGSEVALSATQGAGTFSQTYATGDLATILGGTTAFVGFTGGTGGGGYTQDITNFTYNSVPEPTTIVALAGATGLFVGLRRRRA